MFGRDVFEAAVDGLAEFGESRVVFPIENVTFDKLPQPFDQVQIQRIRWQELELDIECGRQILHHSTVLIRFPIPPESIKAIARNMAMLMWALRDRNTDKPITQTIGFLRSFLYSNVTPFCWRTNCHLCGRRLAGA